MVKRKEHVKQENQQLIIGFSVTSFRRPVGNIRHSHVPLVICTEI